MMRRFFFDLPIVIADDNDAVAVVVVEAVRFVNAAHIAFEDYIASAVDVAVVAVRVVAMVESAAVGVAVVAVTVVAMVELSLRFFAVVQAAVVAVELLLVVFAVSKSRDSTDC